MIGGVWEVLGFQAESGAKRIGFAGFAANGEVEEIAGVELDAGFGGEDFEDAAGVRVGSDGGELGSGVVRGVGSFVEHPIVVVTFGEF